MKARNRIAIIGGALLVLYLAGPRLKHHPLSGELPQVSYDISNVESYVQAREAAFPTRPDNEARIIWNNDSLKNRTDHVVLYLHGYSASWYEGYPVNVSLARSLQANCYLSRLQGHGLDVSDPLIDMEPSLLYETAKEALLIAATLGDTVIVMGTSTGGTLALKLAADFPELVHVLVLLSPNIAINNPAAFLLPMPWGLQIARVSAGGGKMRQVEQESEAEQKYWYSTYRWESTIYLSLLLKETMNADLFEQVKQPLFLGYYYKNEEEQDQVVRVDAMLKMFDQLGTPESFKRKVAFPDAGGHVIGSEAVSGAAKELEMTVTSFVQEIMPLI